jgi:hypothetical protein
MTTTGCTRLMAAATLLIAGACSEPPTLTTRHVAPATLDKSRAVAVGIGPSQTSVDARS